MGRKRMRVFAFSLGVSLFVLLTLAGCVVVDIRGRAMSFGDTRPALEVERLPGDKAQLQVRLFGVRASVDFTWEERLLTFLGEFFCLPPLK